MVTASAPIKAVVTAPSAINADVIVESIDDFLTAIAGSGISVSSSQLTASGGVSTGKAIALSLIFS